MTDRFTPPEHYGFEGEEEEPAAMGDLWDVIAVNLRTYEHRIVASGKEEADADAIVSMAVMRRGVDDEFFKVVPHGSDDGIEFAP